MSNDMPQRYWNYNVSISSAKPLISSSFKTVYLNAVVIQKDNERFHASQSEGGVLALHDLFCDIQSLYDF